MKALLPHKAVPDELMSAFSAAFGGAFDFYKFLPESPGAISNAVNAFKDGVTHAPQVFDTTADKQALSDLVERDVRSMSDALKNGVPVKVIGFVNGGTIVAESVF